MEDGGHQVVHIRGVTLAAPVALVLLLRDALDLLLNASVDLGSRGGGLLALLGDVLLRNFAGRGIDLLDDVGGGTLQRSAFGGGPIVVVKDSKDQVDLGSRNLKVARSAHALDGVDIERHVFSLGPILGGDWAVQKVIDELLLLTDVAEFGCLAKLLQLADVEPLCNARVKR